MFFDLTHSGVSNFIVRVLDEGASPEALLVNVIGAFDGTRVQNLSAGVYLLDIDADGDWTATVRF